MSHRRPPLTSRELELAFRLTPDRADGGRSVMRIEIGPGPVSEDGRKPGVSKTEHDMALRRLTRSVEQAVEDHSHSLYHYDMGELLERIAKDLKDGAYL